MPSWKKVALADVTNTFTSDQIVDSGTTSRLIINSSTHNASVANEARLQLGFGHSGAPDAVGYVKLTENATNSFDGTITIGVPYNNGSGGSATRDALTIRQTGDVTFFQHANFPDNGKALFGASNDLQIYHTGTHSYINEGGTGNLIIYQGSNTAVFSPTAVTINRNASFAGTISLENNKSINFENASGSVKSILAVDSSNITKLGDNSNSGVLQLSAGTATFSGKIKVDEIEGRSNTANTLLLNDDQTAAVNMVTMQSINHINMMTDGNNNGVGSFKVLNGSYDVDTADLAFEIGSNSNATFFGNVVVGDITLSGSTISDNSALTISSGDDVIIDAESDVNIDANGGDIRFKDNGTNFVTFSSVGTTGTQFNNGNSSFFITPDGNNCVVRLDKSATNRGARFEYSTVGSTKWYSGLSDSDHFGSGGDEYFISEDFTTPRFIIEPGGNIGMGVLPSDYHSLADNLVVASSGDTGISIVSGTSSDGRIFFADGTSGSDESRGHIRYDHSDDSMHFVTNDAGSALSIDSSQNATFAGDITLRGTTTSIIGEQSAGATRAKIKFPTFGGDGGITFETTTNGAGAMTEAMRIDQDTNVGIGTTNPSDYHSQAHNLVIYENSNSGMTIASANNASGSIFFADSTTGDEAYKGRIEYNHGTNKLHFGANSVINATLDASGNFGIGTASPTNNLSVYNDSSATSINIGKYASGKAVAVLGTSADTNGYFSIQSYYAQGSTFGNIILNSQGGKVGIGTTSPSHALSVNGEVRFTLGGSSQVTFNTVGGDSAMYMTDSDGSTKINLDTEGDSYFNGGNVGIGTSSPSKKLEVDGSYNLGSNAFINYNATYPYTINVENTAAVGNLTFQAGTGSTGFKSKIELQGGNTATDASITLTTADSARMTILNNGKVGINTTGPSDYLHVVGAIKAQDGSSSVDYTRMFHDGTNGHLISNRGQLRLGAQSDEDAITIDNSGKVGIGTNTPSDLLEIRNGTSDNTSPRVQFGVENTFVPTQKFYKWAGASNLFYAWQIEVANSTAIGFDIKTGGSSATAIGSESLSSVLLLGADKSATFSGDVTIGSNELIFDAGEKVFSTGGYVVADGDAGFIARDSGVNKLIINGNIAQFAGNVGIGVTPSYPLHVQNTADTVAYFKSTDNNGQIAVVDDDTTAYFGANGSRAFMGTASGLAGTTNLVVDSNGKVGIGTTSPSEEFVAYPDQDIKAVFGRVALHSVSSDYATFSHYDHRNSGVNYALRQTSTGATAVNSASGQRVNFNINNLTKMVVSADGNVGIGTTTPSKLLEVSHTSDTNATKLAIVGGTKGFTIGKTFQSQSYGHIRPISSHQVMALRLMPNTVDNDTYFEIFGHDYETDTVNFARGMLILKQSDGNAFQIVSDGNGSESVGPIEFVIENNEEPSVSIEANKTFLGKNLNGQTCTTELGGFGVLATNGTRYGNYGWLTFNAPTTNFTASSRGWALTNGYKAHSFAILKSSNASTEPYLTTNGELGAGATAPFVINNAGSIGIGTGSPDSQFHLHGSSGIRLTDSNQNSNEYAEIKYDNAGNTNLYINNDWTNSNALINFQLAGSTKMVVRGDGNVGIGTSSPTGLLNLYKSNASAVLTIQRREVDGALTTDDIIGQIDFVTNDDSYNSGANTTRASIKADIQSSTSATGLIFETGNSNSAVAEAMYISPNGNVGIGTHNPSHPLQVVGTASFGNIILGGTEQIAVNNGNIYYTGGNLGIGTTNPTQTLDVQGSIISSNVLLAPTYATFIHSFYDDIGTTAHYLPWGNLAEGTGNDSSATSFLAPMSMTLKKLFVRIESISNIGNHNLTVTLIRKADGTITNTTVASATKTFSSSNNNKTVTYLESDFSATPRLTQSQLGSLKIQFGSDYGGQTDFFVTSVWQMNNNTL